MFPPALIRALELESLDAAMSECLGNLDASSTAEAIDAAHEAVKRYKALLLEDLRHARHLEIIESVNGTLRSIDRMEASLTRIRRAHQGTTQERAIVDESRQLHCRICGNPAARIGEDGPRCEIHVGDQRTRDWFERRVKAAGL